MGDGHSGLELPFVDGPIPQGFERRLFTLPPGEQRPYDDAEWSDSIVVVAGGVVELVGICGSRSLVRQGDVLWLAGLPLWALRNPGEEPAVLLAVCRTSRQ